jgi:hypothetical protein
LPGLAPAFFVQVALCRAVAQPEARRVEGAGRQRVAEHQHATGRLPAAQGLFLRIGRVRPTLAAPGPLLASQQELPSSRPLHRQVGDERRP